MVYEGKTINKKTIAYLKSLLSEEVLLDFKQAKSEDEKEIVLAIQILSYEKIDSDLEDEKKEKDSSYEKRQEKTIGGISFGGTTKEILNQATQVRDILKYNPLLSNAEAAMTKELYTNSDTFDLTLKNGKKVTFKTPIIKEDIDESEIVATEEYLQSFYEKYNKEALEEYYKSQKYKGKIPRIPYPHELFVFVNGQAKLRKTTEPCTYYDKVVAITSKKKKKGKAKAFFKKKRNELFKKKPQEQEKSTKKVGIFERTKHKVIASQPGKEFFKASLKEGLDDKDGWKHFFNSLKPFVIAGVALAVLRFDPFHLGKNCSKAFVYVGKLVSFLCGNLPLSSAMVSACVLNLVALVSLCGTASWLIYAIKKRKKKKLEKEKKIEKKDPLEEEQSLSKTLLDDLKEKTDSLDEKVLPPKKISELKDVPTQDDEVISEAEKKGNGFPLAEIPTESLVKQETTGNKKDSLETTIKQDVDEVIEKTPKGYLGRIKELREQVKKCEILIADLDNPISSSRYEETYFLYLLQEIDKRYANQELSSEACELEKGHLLEMKNNGTLLINCKEILLKNINDQMNVLNRNIDLLIEQYESNQLTEYSVDPNKGVSFA